MKRPTPTLPWPWPMLLFLGAVFLIATPRLKADNVVVLNHADGSVTPFQTVELSKGDSLSVVIINTQLSCTTYSISSQQSTTGDTGRSFDVRTSKSLTIVHDGKASAYLVSATRLSGAGSTCTLPDRTWTLPVFTHKWALGFAGAFTVDALTDPVYYLAAGTKDGAAGYYFRENSNAEDSVVLGAAAMVHVYHTKWATWSTDFGWVPLSFGLGVGTTSQTKYFIGTGFRLGDQFFLTLGGAFGSAKRLPDGAVKDGFTTDANALASLPTRRTGAFFTALSFSFLGTSARSALQAPFVSTSNPSSVSNPAPKIFGASWTDKPNGVASVTGSGFGSDKTKVVVTVEGDTATVNDVSDATVTIVVPEKDRAKNPVSIIVTVSGIASDAKSVPLNQ